MPIGSFAILPHIMHVAQLVQPKTILDVGIGYGIYGPAFRQWIDMGVRPYSTIIDGVEGWADYKNPCWDEYNSIAVIPIEQFYSPFKYDMIVFSDVIEHFEKAEGEAILEKLKSFLSPGGILFVGTPAIWLEQNAVHGNEMECHRSLWSVDDFTDCEVILDGTPFLGNEMILVKYTKPNNTFQ
jgi:SAM-dependent methyltransferase